MEMLEILGGLRELMSGQEIGRDEKRPDDQRYMGYVGAGGGAETIAGTALKLLGHLTSGGAEVAGEAALAGEAAGAGLLGTAGGILTSAGGIGAAAALGYEVGSVLDETFGLSDKLVIGTERQQNLELAQQGVGARVQRKRGNAGIQGNGSWSEVMHNEAYKLQRDIIAPHAHYAE